VDKNIKVVKIRRLGVECGGRKVEMEKISFDFGIRVVFEMLFCVDIFSRRYFQVHIVMKS
jgi:hypothetical protein